MPPSLATYQQAASSIYEPQKAAEATQIQATNATTKNSLEAEKGQVGTDYQSAIDKLTQNVQSQSAQIAQTYNERLSGNFSGLQGNDMGALFARTNEAQSIIEQTRANKLAQITAGETNADIKMNADMAALTPKYQSLEANYAQKAYGSAVKDYNDTQYKNAQLSLSEQRLADSAAKTAQTEQDKNAAKYQVTQDAHGNYIFGYGGRVDANNQLLGSAPATMAQYLAAQGGGTINVNQFLDMLGKGSAFDQAVYRQVKASGQTTPQGILRAIAAEDPHNVYGLR